MNIFHHTLKRLFRNKYTMLLILVLPPLLIVALISLTSGGISSLSVGLVDKDNTELTFLLEEALAEKSVVNHIKEEEIQSELSQGRVNYVLVIEEGFTSDILAGNEPLIFSYNIQESNLSMPVRLYAESFIRAARNLADSAGGDENLFYKGMDSYLEGSVKLEKNIIGADPSQRGDGLVSIMGILGLFMLFLAMLTTNNIIKDRENRTFHRIMASPIGQSNYMLQTIAAFLLIMLVQVAVVFFSSQFLIGINFGTSLLVLLAVMSVFAVVCIAFAVAVSAIAKTSRQAGAVSAMLITPMCMLGGLLWPREIMPEFLQRIGQLMPTAWMIDAAAKVVHSGQLLDAGGEILIMLLYAVVFFLLGNWRRVDIAAK